MEFTDPGIDVLDRLEVREAARAAYPLIPCAAFLDGPCDVRWLLPELIPEGGLVVLYGRPKSGKSLFALNVALAQGVMGKEFLRRKSRGARVGLVQLEDPAVLVRNRIMAMIDYVPETLFVSAGKAWGDEERGRLAEYIETLSLQLVVIDPLIMWQPGARENVAEDMAGLMYKLRNVVQATGCTIMAVHHSRKSSGDYGDNLRGSSAILGAADCAIELDKKDDGEVVMRVVSRLATVEDERLELDPETLTWYSLGPAAGAKVAERRAEIVRAIKAAGPISAKDLQADLSINRATLQRDLKTLRENGVIEVVEEVQKRGGRRNLYAVSVPLSHSLKRESE